MSDERIERALRQGPPNEPAYIPVLHLPPAPVIVERRPLRLWRAAVRSSLAIGQLAVTALVVAAVIGGALLLRMNLTQQGALGEDLLARINAADVIRIAVRPDYPQVAVPGGARTGFDVDVANELGRRLGVRVDLLFVPVEEMLGRSDDWDIALPSTSTVPSAFVATDPYYDWPVNVVVSAESSLTSLADLRASTICVVSGSSGEAWLDGNFHGDSVTSIAPAPAPGNVLHEATDEACLADLADGASVAAVTANLSEADLAARGSVAVLGKSVLTEARPVIARGDAQDSSRLIEEINISLTAMLTDGTLETLSRSRFGGFDLSRPPVP